MKRITTYFLLLMILAGCQKEEGPEVSKKIILNDFHTVVFKQIFDVSLIPDTSNFAIVTCGENLINNVSLECTDKVLFINQTAETNWNRSYKHTGIELHFKNLSLIQMRNCIKLESKDTIKSTSLIIQDYGELSEVDITIDCRNFSMAVYGENCGIYNIEGKTLNSSLTLDGSAHFITEYLTADSVYVNHKGIGDCFVNASRVLAGKIILDGMIRYKKHSGLKVEIENERGELTGF